jgi:hypothetical protein
LQYRVVYKRGTENRVADALSRHPEPPAQLLAISTSTPTWLIKVQEGYEQDPQAKATIAALSVNPGSVPNYTWTDGLLRYNGRVWIGNNTDLQQMVHKGMHASTIGGH